MIINNVRSLLEIYTTMYDEMEFGIAGIFRNSHEKKLRTNLTLQITSLEVDRTLSEKFERNIDNTDRRWEVQLDPFSLATVAIYKPSFLFQSTMTIRLVMAQ